MTFTNSKTLIVLLLAFGLVIFGCVSNSPSAPPTQPSGSSNPSPSSGTPSSDSGATGSNPSSPPSSPPAVNPAPAPAPSPAPSSGGPNLNGLGYAQLSALGIPLECNIRSTYSGRTTNIHVYINGAHQARSEIGTMEGSRCSFVGVLKDNKMYLGCSSGSYIQNCDWLQIDIDPSAFNQSGSTPTNPGTSSMNYNDVPPADIQCNPWVLDTSKFDTPGRICNMNSISGGYGAAGSN